MRFQSRVKEASDAGSRQIGKAELLHSGSKSGGIGCSFREYKIDSSNPKDQSRWDETSSGTTSLQMPPTGEVEKITVSMILTKKVVGDEDVAVNEKPLRFTIVLE